MSVDTGVYFIYAPKQKTIKIGRSNNIKSRFRNLRTGFMDEGILLCGILTYQPQTLENDLHQKFNHLRVDGEWFIVGRDLVDYLKDLGNMYPTSTFYSDLAILDAGMTYSDLKMYLFMQRVKVVLVKIVVPIALMLTGLIIAYYFREFYQDQTNHTIYSYWYGTVIVIVVYITVVMPQMIIKYCTMQQARLYFILITLNFSLAFMSITFFKDIAWFMFLQTAAALLYVFYARQLLYHVAFVRTDEATRKLVGRKCGLNPSELIEEFDRISKSQKRQFIVFKTAGLIIALMTYISLNAVLVISKPLSGTALAVLIILNACVIAIALFRQQNYFAEKWVYVFPLITFLVIVTGSTDRDAFTKICYVLIPSITLSLPFLLWYSWKKRRSDVQLKEIISRLKFIATDLENQIRKLNDLRG